MECEKGDEMTMNGKRTSIITFSVVWLLVFGLCGLQAASADEGNISPTDKYAWAEQTGWLNFRPTHCKAQQIFLLACPLLYT
jgi:hypothetical protein